MNLLLSIIGQRRRFDPDALDYFSRAEALGGSFDQTAINASYTEAYCKGAISDCIAGLKTDAVWSKITELYLMGFVSFAGLMAKVKHAGTATLTNTNFASGDYLAAGSGAGLKGNAANKRLSTGLVVSDHLSAGDGSLGIYAEDMETAVTKGFIGVADAPTATAPHALLLQDTGSRRGVIAGHYSNPNTIFITAASPVASAFEIISRTSTTDSRFYRNGTQSGSTNTNTSTDVADGMIGLFSLRYGTGTSEGSYSFGNYSAMRAKVGFVGAGITDTEAANISSRINTLMTAIGANVY